jgi:hypothetical protein
MMDVEEPGETSQVIPDINAFDKLADAVVVEFIVQFKKCVAKLFGRASPSDTHISHIGSGTLYCNRWYVLTCAHCIHDKDGILRADLHVEFDDDEPLPAEVVHTCVPFEWPDLALLRVGAGSEHSIPFMSVRRFNPWVIL